MARSISDLRKLRHVVGVAQLGSFTAASQALAITQSALTKSVADVENTLGLKLFERLPRGVALTDAGRVFVPRAERLLADSEDLMLDLGDLQALATGQLRLGVAPGAFAGFLVPAVSAFARVYPGLRVTVAEGPLEDMASSALQGTIDLIVGATNYLGRWNELETLPATPLQVYVVTRLDHPITQHPQPSPRQLLQYPVVLPASGLLTDAELAQVYSAAGLTPRPPQYVCDHFPLVRQLVRNTDAISPVVTLPRALRRIREDFAVFEELLAFDDYALGLAWRRSREPGPAARAFTELFQGLMSNAAET